MTSRPEDHILKRLIEYNPLEIKCDDEASRADVTEFVTAVLSEKPAQLQGDQLSKAVKFVERTCQVAEPFFDLFFVIVEPLFIHSHYVYNFTMQVFNLLFMRVLLFFYQN